MAWQTPKTNWEIKPTVNGMYNGDWFNAEDYNRIARNLEYLASVGSSIYGKVDIQPMPIIEYSYFALPSYINLIEDNLYAIASKTFRPPTYSGKKEWKANAATPTVDDLNRWERAMLDIFMNYREIMNGWTKMPFNLPHKFGRSEF